MAATRPNIAAIVFSGLLAGCAVPWPDAPPKTYEGIVINYASRQPLPDVKVVGWRAKYRIVYTYGSMPEEIIGTAVTDQNGHFVLTTSGGYLGRFAIDGLPGYEVNEGAAHSPRTGLVLYAYPVLEVDNRAPATDDTNQPVNAVNQMIVAIIAEHDRNPATPYQSINAYLARGVITQNELDMLVARPDLFEYPNNLVRFEWARREFIYSDLATPIQFEPLPDPDSAAASP
jgi:hypothetical protein